jgi:uncharacterized membrane protein
MPSKARIAGVAAPPTVVVLPIALFTITVAALLAYVGTGDASCYRAALIANVAGVLTALVALAAGARDLRSLSRPSRSRTIALRHAAGALLVTGVFAGSGALLYRGWGATLPLAIGVLGLVLLVSVVMLGLHPLRS